MLSNYPPGVTDSDIDRHFGDDDEEPMPTLDEIDEDDPAWDGTFSICCHRPTVYCDCR